MTKKIIAVLLCACMLFTCFTFSYAEDNAVLSESAGDAYDVLNALGYVNSDYTRDMIADMGNVSRAEFAEMTYKIFGDSVHSDKIYFHDVPSTHFAANPIVALVEKKIISVSDDRMFYPEDAITKNEAAKMLLYALGYGDMCEYYGGWQSGVVKMSAKLNLFKGTERGETVSYSDMLVMFYNALTTEVFDISGYKDGEPVLESKGETYLSLYRKIYIARGTVTAVDGISVYGDETDYDEIIIGNLKLKLNGVKAENYLGRDVKFLYDKTEESTLKLIWIKAERNDDVLDLNKFDNSPVFDMSSYTVDYNTSDGSKRKTAGLSKNLNVLYNGEFVDDGVEEVLTDDFYSARLIKSKGSSSYDIVIVEGYENYQVASVTQDEKMFLKACDNSVSDRNVYLKDYDKVQLISANGEKLSPKSISNESVVSVFESRSQKRIKIVVSSESVSGLLSQLSKDGEYTVYHIDDNKYKTYKSSIDINCKVGDNVVFLLDMNGLIAKSASGAVTGNFGYLFDMAYQKNGIDDKLMLKMYTKATGVAIFDVAEKVKVDGVEYNKQREKVYNLLGEAKMQPQPVAYELNSDGEIRMLDLPQDESTVTVKTKDNMLVCYDSGSKSYDDQNKRLGFNTILNSSTYIFGVPSAPKTANEKLFSTASISDLERQTTYDYVSYSYSLDALDDCFCTDLLLMYKNFGLEYWVSTYFAVDTVMQGINEDGETVYMAEGYHGSAKKTIEFTKACKPNPAELHKGDVLSVETRIGKAISEYVLKYCPHTGEGLANNKNYVVQGACAFIGYINDIKDNIVKIGFESGEKCDQMISLQSAKILIYDPNGEFGFYEGTAADLLTYKTAGNDCDKVLVYMANSELRNFIVYKK